MSRAATRYVAARSLLMANLRRRRAEVAVWRVVAATGLAVAGLTSLGYAGWLVTARRAVFAAIASASAGAGRSGDTPVPLGVASDSDAADSAWWWATVVLLLVALGLWCVTRMIAAEQAGAVAFAAGALVAVGVVVCGVGAVVGASVGGDPAAADRAATGSVVVGAGLLLVALGLFTGAVSVLHGRPPPSLGYAGWNTR